MGSAPRRYRPAHFRQVTRRDPALDLLRVIALARVVLWHVLAATWMTFFAAIPLMFFVAGTLLDGSQRRRSYRFSCTEVESRVVPWTPDRLIHHQSLRQRTAVMCADGACREYLLALPHQNDRLIIEMAQ